MPEAARRLPPFVFAVAAIVVILLVNAWMDATGRGRFFTLAIQDGRLFGMPVDVLKHAARLAISAIGMTLVIAGGGVDLSVGAVADVAVFKLERGNFGFVDSDGFTMKGNQRLQCEMTLLDGKVMFDQNGRSSALWDSANNQTQK